MIDKVSKSLQSKDISTSTAARMLGGQIYGVCKMLELMKSLQGLQTMLKRWIFPTNYHRRERNMRAGKNEGIDLKRQQKFSNECLEVYDSVEIKKA